MAGSFRNQYHWIFCVAALAVWLALGWPFLQEFVAGTAMRGFHVPAFWILPFALFGAALLGSIMLKLSKALQWTLLCVQLAAVLAMAIVIPSDLMSVFLIVIAWQAVKATTPVRALIWVIVQTLAIVGVLAQAPNPDLSSILVLSFALQLSFVLTAYALRSEAEASSALAEANRELRSAQAIIAGNARDAERLRISRELHDAWGHELTALGLQLEIASHVGQPGRARHHVMQAKDLARALLGKVRDAVGALRNAERSELLAIETLGGGKGIMSADAPYRLHRTGAADGGPATFGGSSRISQIGDRYRWFFCLVALAVWLALGWPAIESHMSGAMIRGFPVSPLWFIPFALLGTGILIGFVVKLPPRLQWTLLFFQVAAVATMAIIVPWAGMSPFLVIIAWQVAMATTPLRALGWAVFQTALVLGALTLAPEPDLCWVNFKAFALQLFIIFPAQALRRESETTRALARTNRELRAAQAFIASVVRDAERLRISRELHDAWGHELTALGLQLEIASQLGDTGRASDHVLKAKGLASALLAKVRDVVAALKEAERCDLKDGLEALAKSVPSPVVHVAITPGVEVGPDQAHALMRCAQEAVTNAVRHAKASNLWLEVASDGEGVRLVARNDGSARPNASSSGSGLIGMRERVESLGGRLAVRAGVDFGFTVEAWLPSRSPQAA